MTARVVAAVLAVVGFLLALVGLRRRQSAPKAAPAPTPPTGPAPATEAAVARLEGQAEALDARAAQADARAAQADARADAAKASGVVQVSADDVDALIREGSR